MAYGMAAQLATSSDYVEVSPAKAQELADEGKLVIGAWANPGGGHGHVVTVRPEGIAGDAPPHGSTLPLVNDIGASDRVAGKNYAFARGDAVHYYTPVGGN